MNVNLGTELLVAGISVGMILWHLERMVLGSAEVKGDGVLLLVGVSVKDDSSMWVTSTMDTWGGKTIVDGFVANSVVAERSNFEDRSVG